MAKKLLEIAAEIVQAQVSTNQLATEEIVFSLRQVFGALKDMQKAELEDAPFDAGISFGEGMMEETVGEKMDPRDSIQYDKVICLECGAEMRQLTAKHLDSHGLTIREYKRKYGFPLRQSLSARSLSEARSKAAKERGLPQNLQLYQAELKRRKELALQESLEMPGEAVPEKAAKAPRGRRSKTAAE